MKTEKYAIRASISIALIFLLAFAVITFGSYVYVYPAQKITLPIELQTKIQNSQDIEDLRKIALLLDNNYRVVAKSSDELQAATTGLLITISLFAFLQSVFHIGLWARHLRQQRGEIVPWWLRVL